MIFQKNAKSGQFFTFSVFHFWHLHFCRLSNDILYYYILYIIYNNKNNNWIITTSLSIHPHPSSQPGKSSVFHNVDKVKCQKWKSEKLKKCRCCIFQFPTCGKLQFLYNSFQFFKHWKELDNFYKLYPNFSKYRRDGSFCVRATSLSSASLPALMPQS